jgi:hypothetical protein
MLCVLFLDSNAERYYVERLYAECRDVPYLLD